MIFALRINGNIRVATRDVTIKENISGTDYNFPYRPAILSFSPMKDSLSLENGGQPEIPSSAVKIADPDKEYFNILNQYRIDDVPVILMKVSEEGVVQSETNCTISDLVSETGSLSFDLRSPEDMNDTKYMRQFTPVTFQWLEVPQVSYVQTVPTWTKMPDVPWKIIGTDYRRAYFESGGDKGELGLIGSTSYPGSPTGIRPKFGLTPARVNPDLAYQYVTPNWGRVESYPLMVNHIYNRLPINRLYQPYYGFNNITYNGLNVNSLYKTSGSSYYDPATFKYNYLNNKETLFDGNRSAYYDFINNEFINAFGTYPAGYRPTYGEDIPVLAAGKCLLSLSTAVASQPPYYYAQIGSSGENAEIIAYLIAGAGCLWLDISGVWYWRSAGQVQSNVNGRVPVDNRMYHLSGIPCIDSVDPLRDIGYTVGFTVTPLMLNYMFKKRHKWREPVWQVNIGLSGTDQSDFDLVTTYRNNRHTFDRILINTNNFTPDPENDPDYSAGFIWLGQANESTHKVETTYSGYGHSFNFEIPVTESYKLFLRYKLKSLSVPTDPPYIYDLRDIEANNERSDNATNSFTLAELQIHNRHLDPDSDYAIAIDSIQSSIELPDPKDPRMLYFDSDDGTDKRKVNKKYSPFLSEDDIREQKVEIYQLDYYAGFFKILVSNLDPDTISRLSTDLDFRRTFDNRYRGLRIDQILSSEQLKADVSTAVIYNDYNGSSISGSVSVEEQSANIVNNATERFAVIKSSSIVVDGVGPTAKVYEWLFFHIPAEGGYQIRIEENEDPAEDANLVQTKVYGDAVKKFKLYTNKLSYRPRYNTALDQQRNGTAFDYGQSEANNYFKNTSYRIIHDPVPENSEDIGRNFPIIYGRVYRAPLLHVISRKTLYENDETAGDDIYIYASHPCDVVNGHDIVLEYEVEDKTQTQSESEQQELQRTNMSNQVAKSPFPSYEDGHVQYDGISKRRTSMRLWLPYHALVEKEDLTGRKYYGIRLRGSEWRSEAGKGDKRFPIRNGLGNTKLYGTLGGWVDNSGEITGRAGLIEHPVDVIRHFAKYYGRKPYNDTIIDITAASEARSRTSDYRVSIFMEEELKTSEFVSKICQQFCLFYGQKNSTIYLFSPKRSVDKSKPIIDRLNVIGDVVENMDGYKSAVTEITYKYGFDRPSGSYKHTINLNAENNTYLSQSSRKLQNKNALVVEADWVADHTTAIKASLEMARIFSAKRRYFNLTIANRFASKYNIGDFVPFTCRDLNVYKLPSYIVNMTELESGLVELRLLSFDESEAAPTYIQQQYVEIPEGSPVPEMLVAPAISGSVQINQILSTTDGTWNNTPSGYYYQWRRGGVDIAGATSSTYTVVGLDIYEEITCEVTAYNAGGDSIPAISNTLASHWQPILALKPDTIIFDGTDPYCYGGAAIGSPVENVYAVTGQLIATQSLTSRQATRSATNRLQFDGTDDYYIGASAYAAYFNADTTYTLGADNVPGSSGEWFLHAIPSLSVFSPYLWATVAGTTNIARNQSRYSDVGAQMLGLLGAKQNLAVTWDYGSPGDGRYYDITSAVTLANTAAPAIMAPKSFTYWTLGGNYNGSATWVAHMSYMSIEPTTWDTTTISVFRSCAIAAGVMV